MSLAHTAESKRLTQVDGVRLMPAHQFLEEISHGIGPSWRDRPLYGASRSGLTPAKEAIGKHPERYKPIDPCTVFYNPMRILLGSIALLDEDGTAGITSPDYVVLKCKPGVMHYRVFYHWLRSEEGKSLIRELARGGVRERILFNRLRSSLIPVLPWHIQVELASKLVQVEKSRAAAAVQLEAIEALPFALLRKYLKENR